jgi:hypothetical protein
MSPTTEGAQVVAAHQPKSASTPSKKVSKESAAALHELVDKAAKVTAAKEKKSVFDAKKDRIRASNNQLPYDKNNKDVNKELLTKTKTVLHEVRKENAKLETSLPFKEKLRTKKYQIEHSKLVSCARTIGIPSCTKEASSVLSLYLSKAVSSVIKAALVHALHNKKKSLSKPSIDHAIEQINASCVF